MATPTQVVSDATDVTDWLTVEQIAGRCDVSYDTAGDWLRSGELAGVKLGRRWRVHPDDLADFVERQRRGAGRGAA